MSESPSFLFSRLPMVATDRRFVGWKFAVASVEGERLDIRREGRSEYSAALSQIVRSASWDSLLCGGRVLIPMDRALLFSDIHDHLPRNRVCIALADDFELDTRLASQLHGLHRVRGTRLCLMDYARRDPREQLLSLTDTVHVDRAALSHTDQDLLVRRAHRRKVDVLATGVSSDAEFVDCRTRGFDLFIGDHYAQPGACIETQASLDGRVLLKLLLEARNGLEIDDVTEQIQANPVLKEALLRLVNSLELARAQKIEVVQQALIMIGGKGLSRWLNLLLFQVGGPNGNVGPLFRVAASRARLMELLVCDDEDPDAEAKDRGEQAFLVGILSLVHVLLGTSRQDAIEGLPLSEEHRNAVLDHNGDLGELLRLAECLDEAQFPQAAEIAAARGIDGKTIWAQQCAAYQWVSHML